MARVSFTLRRTVADLGSYLRYDDILGVRTNDDSALRADSLQTAPATITSITDSSFAAESVTYGEVALDWSVPITTVLTASPEVTEALVVYSPSGAPQTILSGTVLVESADQFTFDHVGVAPGRWAYYSLFVHYQSNVGDSYYERVASLAVLPPVDYGSTKMLWDRIPLFYRVQDTSLGDTDYEPGIFGSWLPTGTPAGPLLKYLSIFGFDMDRVRTLLDYQMVSYDPSLANVEHLDALSKQLGLDLRSTDLGPTRLRTLLNDVGVYRRSKGTLSGTEFAAQALAGADVEINQVNGQVKIYAQRVNYITAPLDGTGIITHRPAFGIEVFSPQLFSSTAASGGSGTYTVTAVDEFSPTAAASVGIHHVMIHLNSPIPVNINDSVGFSVSSNTGTEAIKWVRLVNAAGATMGLQRTSTNVGGARSFEVSVTSGASVAPTWTLGYIELLVDLTNTPLFICGNMLAERNNLGEYFDGSTVRGGWLIDSATVSDFRWYGSFNASPSMYTEDYQRMKKVTVDSFFDRLPITEVTKYNIVAYSAIPGPTYG